MKTPSELIDISFPKLNDYKLAQLKDFKYTKYNYNSDIGQLTFTGYTLEGFAYDLFNIIFGEEGHKPWKDTKADKRLYRVLLLSIFMLYQYNTSENNRKKLIENLKDICLKKTDLNPELVNLNHGYFRDYHKHFQITLQNVNKNINGEGEKKYMRMINKFFQPILNDPIITKVLQQDGQIDYLQKYMRYKKKYYEFKKKINK